MPSIDIKAIGQVHCSRVGAIDDFWGNTISTIELDSSLFTPDAVQGLTDYSHLLVVYYFDKVPDEKVLWSSGHPRGNKDWPKVGIFAQRKKDRPNKIGVSICELLEVNGLSVKVKALDAIDGTPILDIKPHVKEFIPDAGKVRQPAWMTELMKDYYA
ncbi:MAG TPA: SAM-dependent methyltransferase [Terriglobales bacterium]|nr:SAM-dependent methyltransferase [Terriglobales bacterium]